MLDELELLEVEAWSGAAVFDGIEARSCAPKVCVGNSLGAFATAESGGRGGPKTGRCGVDCGRGWIALVGDTMPVCSLYNVSLRFGLGILDLSMRCLEASPLVDSPSVLDGMLPPATLVEVTVPPLTKRP